MKLKNVIIPVFFVMFTVACDSHKKTNPESSEKENEHAVADHKEENHKHWSYEGETGPEHWAEIEKEGQCDAQHQSPINIIEVDAAEDKELKPLDIQYAASTKIHDVINNGHSIQYNFEPGDYLNYNGEKYELKQIHFHEESEHTINGVRYPMEIHLVHMNSKRQFAVLAVMVEEGKSSTPFEFLESFLPVEQGQTKPVNASFNLNENLPAKRAYYYYTGSLTTPPCTEGVNWFVFKEPISISLKQVEMLKNLMPVHNYRTEQPLNGRVVKMSR